MARSVARIFTRGGEDDVSESVFLMCFVVFFEGDVDDDEEDDDDDGGTSFIVVFEVEEEVMTHSAM